MISMAEYKLLMRDRPHKFGQYQVGFTQTASDTEHRCGRCFHYYTSLIGGRSVCEIFKGRGPDRKVPSSGSCMFFTRDGTVFPRMAETSEPPKSEAEPNE